MDKPEFFEETLSYPLWTAGVICLIIQFLSAQLIRDSLLYMTALQETCFTLLVVH